MFIYIVPIFIIGFLLNGIASTKLLIPYAATFFCFADYMRPAIRLAALSKHHSIYLFTHDSIGVGEDGPTHQPVEHLASLRAVPQLTVIRPADANETFETWKYALINQEPVVICLTRQKVKTLDQSKYATAANLQKGAYNLTNKENPEGLLIATGSEVEIAIQVADELEKEGKTIDVISMPSWEIFEKQTKEYKDQVLPPSLTKRIAIEAGIQQGWERYLGEKGIFIGLQDFGISAPGKEVFQHFGITKENLLEKAKAFYS